MIPYPISDHKSYRYVSVIAHNFSKWVEFVAYRKAAEKADADGLFDQYVSKQAAPVKLFSVKDPLFLSYF